MIAVCGGKMREQSTHLAMPTPTGSRLVSMKIMNQTHLMTLLLIFKMINIL